MCIVGRKGGTGGDWGLKPPHADFTSQPGRSFYSVQLVTLQELLPPLTRTGHLAHLPLSSEANYPSQGPMIEQLFLFCCPQGGLRNLLAGQGPQKLSVTIPKECSAKAGKRSPHTAI